MRSGGAVLGGLLALLLASALSPRGAHADARFVLVSDDEPARGLHDPLELEPVGGNGGRTLGEQRRIAIQHALDIWGAALDSTVEIIVSVRFEDFDCADSRARKGALAGASSYVRLSEVPAPRDDVIYPAALANHLAQRDLDPDQPEIIATFNGNVDQGLCGFMQPFYYGLDSRGGSTDLVEITLHEIAHGLGFGDLIDPQTGELVLGTPDAFIARVLDTRQGRYLSELDDAGRRAALGHVRELVWDGSAVREAAAETLARGLWTLGTTPAVPAFSGAVGRSNLGRAPAEGSVAGELAFAFTTTECAPTEVLDGRVALIDLEEDCREERLIFEAQEVGAVAALVIAAEGIVPWEVPPLPLLRLGTLPIDIPVLTIARRDAQALIFAAADGPVEITLRAEPGRLIGADAEGRPYMAVTLPQPSAVGHWDTALTPDALMEPAATLRATHALDLTLPALWDVGWSRCGDGELQPPEECDDGAQNDDTLADACRSDCRAPSCGDGVVDGTERCDEGMRNGDAPSSLCRRDCTLRRCGDGLLNDDEECDDGAANDDARADACRTSCRLPRCGDGVRDGDEECDEGASTERCSAECVALAPRAQDAAAEAPGCDGGRCEEVPSSQGGCACASSRAAGAGAGAPWLVACLLLWRRARQLRR